MNEEQIIFGVEYRRVKRLNRIVKQLSFYSLLAKLTVSVIEIGQYENKPTL